MFFKKFFVGVLLTFGLFADLYATNGIRSLAIADASYISQSGKPDMAFSLLMAKASNIAYQDSLSSYDQDFFEDNGFANLKLNTSSVSGVEFLTATRDVVVNGISKHIVFISFRGTAGVKDLWTDASLKKTKFIDNEEVIVHGGFHGYFKKFRDYENQLKIQNNELLSSIITSKSDDTFYLLTGHSLGGAIAKLYGASLLERGIKPSNILVYTFGAPPVGFDGISVSKTFSRTYQFRTREDGTPYSGVKVVQYRNFYDPIANLHRVYFKDGGYLSHIALALTYSFDESGQLSNYDMGCKYPATQAILNVDLLTGLIDSFSNEIAYSLVNSDLPNCDYSMGAHGLSLYIDNLYKNIDFYAIAQKKIANYTGTVELSDEAAKAISAIVERPVYRGVVRDNTFNANSLLPLNRKRLIQEIKSLGVGISADSFGQEGQEIRATIKNMVDAKQVSIDELKSIIDDVQGLDASDYMKLAWGTGINVTTAVGDILTLGSASVATKGVKITNSLGKLGKLGTKLKGPLYQAVKIAESKPFIFVKLFVETGFTVTDDMIGMIEDDEATASLVNGLTGMQGDLNKAALEVLMQNNKSKFLLYFVGKLNDIVVKVVQGSTESLITDTAVRQVLDELLVSIGEMVPVAGPIYAQYNLSKKVSEEIDNKPKVINAWNNYFSASNALINDIKVLGDSWFSVRLDTIVSNALSQYDIYKEKKRQELEEIEANTPKLMFTLPSSGTIDNYKISANIGENVSFSPFLTAKSLIECIGSKFEKEVLWKLWYHDVTKGASAPRESVELTLDQTSNTFSFTMPSTQIQVVDLTYNILNEPDNYYAYGSCGLPEKWESVNGNAGSIDTVPLEEGEKDSYEQCIADGGTEIGCQVGLLSINHISLTSNNIDYQGNYIYMASMSEGLKIYDASNPKNPTFVSRLGGIGYVLDIKIVNDYAYIANLDYGMKIIDISNPEKPVVASSIDTNGYARGIDIVGEYAYIADDSEGLKIIDISNTLEPKQVGAIGTGKALDIQVIDNYAYVAIEQSGLKIIDISQPNNPILISEVDTYWAERVDIVGDYAYIADYSEGLKIIDISNPESPFQVGSYDTIYAMDVKIKNNLAFIASNNEGVAVIDVSVPSSPELRSYNKLQFSPQGIKLLNNYAYLFSGQSNNMEIIDISNPLNPSFKGELKSKHEMSYWNIEYYQEKLFLSARNNSRGYIEVYTLNDEGMPILYNEKALQYSRRLTFSDEYIYTHDRGDNQDILDLNSLEKVGEIGIDGYYYYIEDSVIISNDILYVGGNDNDLKIFDISDKVNPVQISEIILSDEKYGGIYASISNIEQYNNHILIDGWANPLLTIMDISNPKDPKIVNEIETRVRYARKICNNTLYYIDDKYNLNIADLSNLPTLDYTNTNIKGNSYGLGCYAHYVIVGGEIYDVKNKQELVKVADVGITNVQDYKIINNILYAAMGNNQGMFIYDFQKLLKNYQEVQNYFYEVNNIFLSSETNFDYSVQPDIFIKSWTFSEDISSFDVEVLNNSYGSAIDSNSFTKNGNTLSVELTPNTSTPINKLELKFTNNGNPVKVSGSDTFWSITKTNQSPRLADGQITQLVSSTSEPAFIEIETHDADGDSVSLSVEDSAGGYVDFDPTNPKRLFASFSDGKVAHTIKIGLDDGKEKIIKEFNVLQFDQTSIESFYSDVEKNAGDYTYDGIAFGTLKGVIWGQPDPDDSTKRIFRPMDPASFAEALKMVINAEKRAGLIELDSRSEYLEAYPSWAMKYYTFARETNALDKEIFNLAEVYPTREMIARIIVKTLDLDKGLQDAEVIKSVFTDSSDFSNAQMQYYGEIVHTLGLFMTGTQAKPQETISRAELAMVIQKISMIPSAKVTLSHESVVQGEGTVAVSLQEVKAQAINSNYELYDSKSEVRASAMVNGENITALPLESSSLEVGQNAVYVVLDNNGVKKILSKTLDVLAADNDGDQVENSLDKWIEDARYAYDDNSNGIPDILDAIFSLGDKSSEGNITINGTVVSIEELINNGGFSPDLDADGISDDLDPDIDGDGTVNIQDAFPYDANESVDTDGDGIGNNADSDDDGDGLSDQKEIDNGLDPLDENDADADSDGDGVSNRDEIAGETNPNENDATIHINPIENIYLIMNTQIAPITIEANASNGSSLTYQVTSSNLDVVVASIDDNLLTLTPVSNAIGDADITVTANLGAKSKSITFEVHIKQSVISLEDGQSGVYEPQEEFSYSTRVDGTQIDVNVADDGTLVHRVTRDGEETYLHVGIAGAEVRLDHEHTATITLPTQHEVYMLMGADGRVTPYVQGALLPKGALPFATQIEADDKKVKFTIPMPARLEF